MNENPTNWSENPFLKIIGGGDSKEVANQHAENAIQKALKWNSEWISAFISSPMQTLKDGFVEIVKKFLDSIWIKLSNLQTEITSGAKDMAQKWLSAITPSAIEEQFGLENSDSENDNNISDSVAKEWISKSKLEKNYKTATDFFVKKWLTLQQSVWVVANLHHESGLNPKAIGDGGKAKWIAQWHPDRREKIKKATGIDVANAPLEKQLEWLWWEITKWDEIATYKAVSKAKTEEEAAKQFCLLFERPANKQKRANERAMAANKLMNKIDMAA